MVWSKDEDVVRRAFTQGFLRDEELVFREWRSVGHPQRQQVHGSDSDIKSSRIRLVLAAFHCIPDDRREKRLECRGTTPHRGCGDRSARQIPPGGGGGPQGTLANTGLLTGSSRGQMTTRCDGRKE